MRRNNGKQRKKLFQMVIACGATVIAAVSLTVRLPALLQGSDAIFPALAAGTVLPEGAKAVWKENDTALSSIPEAPAESAPEVSSAPESSEPVSQASPSQTEAPPTPSSQTELSDNGYAIHERQIGGSGTQYENFYVKNSTGVDISIAEELAKRPDITIKKDGTPQVLLMHTHTTETYLPSDMVYYPENFYPRSTDNNNNVTLVGEEVKKKLEAAGIGVIHDTTQHDVPSYNGSYDRSEVTVKNILNENPTIQVVLDLHRDAIGNAESGKTKPTFVANGKKAAQIMIISGCGASRNVVFPDWEYNLRFALRLQQAAETRYPGMTRPLKFCNSQYNLNLTHGSLLIEIGSDSNSMEEAVYSGQLLGDALVDVLNTLTE